MYVCMKIGHFDPLILLLRCWDLSQLPPLKWHTHKQSYESYDASYLYDASVTVATITF